MSEELHIRVRMTGETDNQEFRIARHAFGWDEEPEGGWLDPSVLDGLTPRITVDGDSWLLSLVKEGDER